ncbi:MAG TPA: hypothetical protein VGU03_10375 [Frateuria sp.]|uniref:hypothetical protein n=1 Tax=Frateuria sp. TaxID=2211372 RepID=UPI002DF1BD67|nr:hypothetical protein [Frateuria sp.]
MIDNKPYANFLSIRQRGKGIPYGGAGHPRADGDANHGFRFAKGKPEVLDWIPELKRDRALDRLVRAINAPASGLFTVGCVSGKDEGEHGVRYSGYVEFAFNSRSVVADAASYFPVFFHFCRSLHEGQFQERVQFNWELEGATFLEADHMIGFTCSVIINTPFDPDPQAARDAWEASLEWLGSYLGSVPPHGDDVLYTTDAPVASSLPITTDRESEHAG